MDGVTQQNAALVQESAAAAASLEEQVHHLTNAVSSFKLPTNENTLLRPTLTKKTSSSSSVKALPATTGGKKTGEDNWEKF